MEDVETRAVGKPARQLIPILMFAYVVCILDCGNVGVAALNALVGNATSFYAARARIGSFNGGLVELGAMAALVVLLLRYDRRADAPAPALPGAGNSPTAATP